MNIPESYAPIIEAATRVILKVMQAGELKRIQSGGDPNEWRTRKPELRMHNAFMHLVTCETHTETTGNPWAQTVDTGLEEYEHALAGLAIVATHRLKLLESQAGVEFVPSVTLDTSEIEKSGE